MYYSKITVIAPLAGSLLLGGCNITLDLGGPGSGLQWMGIITSGTVSRQIESWDDFREFDHTSVALVVAIVDDIPPEAWDPESEWPGPMQWVLLRPQQPVDSTGDQNGENTGDFITDVSWRIDASLETQISLQSTDDAIDAMLELIDSSEIKYVWIAPGFGPLLMPRGDEVRIGMNLPIKPAEAEASQEPSVYDTMISQRAYTQFAWINFLTLNIASNDALLSRLEPVREHSYVFRNLSAPISPRKPVAFPPPLPAAVPASENAALRYWEAWWELGPEAFPSFLDRIRLIDTKTGEPVDQPEPEPPSERGLGMLIAATEMPRCDFGLDLSAAVRDDLTEMSSGDHYWLLLRSFGLLLEQAERQLDRGDPEQAARLYRAALYMIDHASQQPELVTLGIPKAFTDLIDEIEKSNGEFPRSARVILAEATSRFDTEDPFRIVQGLHSLIDVSAESIRKREAENEEGFDPDDLDRIAQRIHEFMDADPVQDDMLWKQLGMNKQNPTRREFEPVIRELREQEAKAIEALTWLRDWSSN